MSSQASFFVQSNVVVRYGVDSTRLTITNDARRTNDWITRHEDPDAPTVFGVGCTRERLYSTSSVPQVTSVHLSSGRDALVVCVDRLVYERGDVVAARPPARREAVARSSGRAAGDTMVAQATNLSGPLLPRRLVSLLTRGSSSFACGPRELAGVLHDLMLADESSPAWFRCKAYADARADASRAGVKDPFPAFGDPEWAPLLDITGTAQDDALLADAIAPTVVKQRWLCSVLAAKYGRAGDIAGAVPAVTGIGSVPHSFIWTGSADAKDTDSEKDKQMVSSLRFLRLPEPAMHVPGVTAERLKRSCVAPYAVWRRGVSTRDSLRRTAVDGSGSGGTGWQPGDAVAAGVRFALRESPTLAYNW